MEKSIITIVSQQNKKATQKGNLNLYNHRILSLGAPVEKADAANKKYVNNKVNTLDKEKVQEMLNIKQNLSKKITLLSNQKEGKNIIKHHRRGSLWNAKI